MLYLLQILILITGGKSAPNNSTDSINFYKKQVLIAESNSDYQSLIINKYKLACFYLEADSIKEAEHYFQDYIQEFIQKNDSLRVFDVLTIIGNKYEEKSFFSFTLKYYFDANKYSINLSPEKQTRILAKIGLLYYELKDFSKAYIYFDTYKKIAEQYKLQDELRSAHTNIGEVYRFNSKHDSAIIFYKKALEYNKISNDKLSEAIIFNNMASVFLNQKKYKDAYNYFVRSKEIIEEIEDQEKLSAINTSFGHYYFEVKNYSQAITSYEKTFDYDIDSEVRKNIIYRDAYEGLYSTYLIIGDYKNAYYYFHLFSKLNEKVLDIEKHEQIVQIESKLEMEKQVQKIQFLEKIAEKEKKKKIKLAIIFVIISFLLSILIILLLYTFRLRYRTIRQKQEILEKEKVLIDLENEKRKAENQKLLAVNKELEASEIIAKLQRRHLKIELDHKKRELASQTLYIGSKNEILNQIKENLKKRSFLNKNKQVINTIIREINNNINLDKDWDSFKLHFEEIHSNFFTRLKESYDDITVEELKLCAYLRINLSSKEIAQLLNITAVAINKRRNRLRKKLNIDSETDLYHFISRI